MTDTDTPGTSTSSRKSIKEHWEAHPVPIVFILVASGAISGFSYARHLDSDAEKRQEVMTNISTQNMDFQHRTNVERLQRQIEDLQKQLELEKSKNSSTKKVK